MWKLRKIDFSDPSTTYSEMYVATYYDNGPSMGSLYIQTWLKGCGLNMISGFANMAGGRNGDAVEGFLETLRTIKLSGGYPARTFLMNIPNKDYGVFTKNLIKHSKEIATFSNKAHHSAEQRLFLLEV